LPALNDDNAKLKEFEKAVITGADGQPLKAADLKEGDSFIFNYPIFHYLSNVDFLPTLLDLAGDKKDLGNFDGYTFKNALEKKKYTPRSSMYHELGYQRAITKGDYKYYAIRYPEWAYKMTLEQRKDTLAKYTKFRESFGEHAISTDPTAPFGILEMVPGGGGAENAAYRTMPNYTDPDQFYDLKNDSTEQHNLINDPKYADKVKELKKLLKEEYLDKLPGKYPL